MSIFNGFDNTIVSLASPPGACQRAIVRMSGNSAFEIIGRIFLPCNENTNVADRIMVDGAIEINHADMPFKICATVYYLKAPKTYTFEDVVEIHFPGSVYIADAVVRECCRAGAVMAKAGEFTLRAFLNGRIDLAQAEAVESMISASSEAERRAAISRMEGIFSGRVRDWRGSLIEIAAQMEGELDFEQDEVSSLPVGMIVEKINGIVDELKKIISSASVAVTKKGYIPVTLVGLTNAGKSSLINSLLGNDCAVVSSERTTTRDILDFELYLEPFHFIFQDSPGFDSRPDMMAKLASERAASAGELSGIIMFVVDTSEPYCAEYEEIIKKLPAIPVIVVANKSDLECRLEADRLQKEISSYFKKAFGKDTLAGLISVSAKDNYNITELTQAIIDIAVNDLEHSVGGDRFNLRVYEELAKASENLVNAVSLLDGGELLEIVVEDIRSAYKSLSHIIGEGYAEEVLESIFSRFCIGK